MVIKKKHNDFDSEPDDTKTKFNAGIAKLERIDKIKMRIHNARFVDDYVSIKHGLKCFRRELHEEMNKEDIELASELEKNMVSLIDVYGSRKVKTKRIDVEKAIDKFELWLLSKEHQFGMSMVSKTGKYEAADL